MRIGMRVPSVVAMTSRVGLITNRSQRENPLAKSMQTVLSGNILH